MNVRDHLQPLVAAGMVWLDKIRPQWYNEVDIYSLDVGSSRDCICGQLRLFKLTEGKGYGDPENIERLGLAIFENLKEQGIKHGDYNVLTELWREVIERKRTLNP